MPAVCPSCGTTNPDEAARCITCDTSLLPPTQPEPGRPRMGDRVVGFIAGAIAAGLVGGGFPVVALILAGGVAGVLFVDWRWHRRHDAVADFIGRAAGRGVLDATTAQRLLLHRRWESGAGPPAPAPRLEDIIPPPPAAADRAEPLDESAPTLRLEPEVSPVMPPLPEAPTAQAAPPSTVPQPRRGPDLAALLRRVWEPIKSDLAVHGLAYLGVLFVFVGVVGFVLFAFTGVGSTLRPIAEVTIPAALFGSAWFLRRTQAPFVARSLELLGGLLTPVVLFAAFADGAPFPPDLDDEVLVITLTLIAVALSGLYAVYTRRHPDTSLRFLVAPLLWTAAGVVGLAFEGEPSAAQFAAVAVAVAFTTLLAGRFGDHRLSRPTLAIAVAGSVGAFALVLLFAATSAWPPIPVIVAAAALLVVVETRWATLPLPWVWQLATGVVAAAAVAETWDVEAVAATAAVLALAGVEWWAHHGEREVAPLAGVGLYAVATAAAAGDPAWWLAAAGVGSIWLHTRRIIPLNEQFSALFRWGGVVAPIIAVAALRELAGPDTAWSVVAGLVTVAALAVRRVRSGDAYLNLWLIGAAVVLAAASGLDEAHQVVALAMALAAVAVFSALAKGPGLGVWATSAAAGWALVQAVWALELDGRWAPVALAGTGLAALAWSIGDRRPWAQHIGAAGLVAGVVALGWRTDGWWLVGSLGTLTLSTALLLVATLSSKEPPAVIELLTRTARAERRSVDAALGLVVTSLGAVWLVSLLDATALDTGRLEWSGVVVGGWAVLVAGATRALGGRQPLAQVLAWTAFAWSVVGALAAAGSQYPEMVSLALLTSAVVATSSEVRRVPMTWSAWAATAALAISIGRHSGVATSDLHRVPLVWGAAALLASLTWRRLRAANRAGKIRFDIVPPVALGAAASLTGVVLEAIRPAEVMWPWMIGAALAAGIVAVLASIGALSALAWGLLTIGGWAATSVQDWLADGRIWPTAPWVAMLCLAAALLRGTAGEWWRRWDLPPFVIAHLAAVVGIGGAVIFADVPATWASFGAVSVAVAAGMRRWPWAGAAAVLFIGAALAAGDGWPTGTLAGLSAVSIVLAMFQDEPVRGRLHAIAAGLALAGWGAAVVWREWWPDPAIAITAVGAGLVAVTLATAVRSRWITLRVAASWTFAALIAELAAIATVTVGDRRPVGLGVAIGLALWALGLGLAAKPLEAKWLRHAAVAPAVGSGLALIYSQQPARELVVLTVAGIGLALAVVGLWLRARHESAWGDPVLIGSAAADVVAGVAGLTLLPEVDSLIVVLAATGIKLLGAAVVLPSPVAAGGSVWALTAAWLLFAGEAAAGNPQWFAIPTGVALGVTSDLVRWYVRRTGRAGVNLLPVDAVAAGLLFGPSLVQTVTSSVAYGLLVMVLGVAVAGWGLITQVRRRLVIGAAGVVAGAVMMLVVPLARIIPQFRGPALWASVIVLGVALIGAAVGIERGRSTLRLTIGRLRDLTSGWE